MRRHPLWLITVLLLLPAAQGFGQAVLNPRIVEFDPSPDHSNLTPNGQPMVTRYDLGFYLIGATQPFQVASLGKPIPNTAGKIAVDFSTLLSGWPLANGDYVARVTAVGPTGTGLSEASNSFTFLTCAYAITPASTTVPVTGGTTSVTLTTPTGCAWTASSGVSWVTVGAASGTGSATITLTVAANSGTTQRTGTVTVGGQAFSVTQSASCAYSVSPTTQALSASAATGSISVGVTSGSGCSWSASSTASWLTVSPTSGTGAGTVSYSATANPTATTRAATVTVAGATVNFTQAGVACSYAISPTSQSVDVAGGSGTINVTAPTGCTWTAATPTTWITLGSITGSGTGSVSFTVAANTGGSRTGAISVAGQSFAVSQSACAYALSATSYAFTATGGTGTVTVTSSTGCTWTSTSGTSWLSVTPASGSGAATVSFTAAPNGTSTARSGTLTIAGQAFAVSQAAAAKPLPPTGVRIIVGGQ